MSPIDFLAYLASFLMLGFGALPTFGLFDNDDPYQVLPGDTLLSHLEYARHEAITQQRTITVCPSTDGRHCATSPAWEEGWVTFADTKGARGQQNSGDELLYFHVTDPSQTTLGISAHYVSYLPDGGIEVH